MALVVKPHHPWKTRLLFVLVVCALVLGGWSLFEYGRFSAGYDSVEAGQAELAWSDERQSLNQQIAELRAEKAVLERAAQIESKAYAELDETLRQLQAEILELNEELAFYRGIVSPRDAARGLRLQSVKLEPNGQPRGYRYKVILTQVLKNDRLAYGQVHLDIEGLQNGQATTLRLSQVSEKSVKELAYRFKYFQSLEGNMNLPDGFQALRLHVRVMPRGQRKNEISKTLDWPLKENPTDVGKQPET